MAKKNAAETVGTWIAMLGIMFCSWSAVGDFKIVEGVPPWGWIVLSALLGGIGTAMGHSPRVAGFAGGLVAGVCVPLTLMAYIQFRPFPPGRLNKLEFLLVFFVGALPGLLTFYVARWALTPGPDEFDTLQNARRPDDSVRDDRD